MGFSFLEKQNFAKTLRNQEQIQKILDTSYPEEIIMFLKEQNLLKLLRDYALIPRKQKLFRPESLTVTYLLDSDTDIYSILLQFEDFLSPPVIKFESYLYNNIFQVSYSNRLLAAIGRYSRRISLQLGTGKYLSWEK